MWPHYCNILYVHQLPKIKCGTKNMNSMERVKHQIMYKTLWLQFQASICLPVTLAALPSYFTVKPWKHLKHVKYVYNMWICPPWFFYFMSLLTFPFSGVQVKQWAFLLTGSYPWYIVFNALHARSVCVEGSSVSFQCLPPRWASCIVWVPCLCFSHVEMSEKRPSCGGWYLCSACLRDGFSRLCIASSALSTRWFNQWSGQFLP